MATELGPHHPRLARVRELLSARGRREQRRFVLEGPTLFAEAQRSGLALREVYVAQGTPPPRTAADDSGVPTFSVPERVFARLSDVESPSGLLAVADIPAFDVAALLARPGPVLLLAGVADPGNAGTLVRSAEAFGAAAVLFGAGGVDPYAPKVVRAAMGSLFRVPAAVVDAATLLEAAAAASRPVVAADVDGEPLGPGAIPGNAVLAVGNERRGVRDWLPGWDRAVRIPQHAAAESLNAAVAGSILLYEIARDRGAG